MSLLQWNETYSVQVKSIDQQHQMIFSSINELHDALRAGRGREMVGRILNLLIEYTVLHFSAEEVLLEKNGYPELATHRVAHKALVDRVIKLQKDFESGDTSVAIELMEFLQEWLKGHIQGTDKQYSLFLNGKGIH